MFDQVRSKQELQDLALKMRERNFEVDVVITKEEALEALKNSLPEGAEVMTGSSTTLNEIGFSDYLGSKDSKFISIHQKINQENDEVKRQDLRRKAVASDYFISSVNAVTEDGVLVAVDMTGSRVGAMPFAAKKLIIVVSSQKITKDLNEAMKRIREYVFPKEDARSLVAYGSHSAFGKWVIFEREVNPSRVKVILVEESLGF